MGKYFSKYRVLTFDCYGTLIDWESGMVTGLKPLTEKVSRSLTRDDILEAHAYYESTTQRWTPAKKYYDLLAVVYRRLAEEWGVEVTWEECLAYGTSVRHWPAFEDSREALAYLKGRAQIAVDLAESLKVPLKDVPRRVAALGEERRSLEKELADVKRKLAMGGGGGAPAGPEDWARASAIDSLPNSKNCIARSSRDRRWRKPNIERCVSFSPLWSFWKVGATSNGSTLQIKRDWKIRSDGPNRPGCCKPAP